MKERKRNRLILAAAIIASGIFVSFYGGDISYAIFYVTLLIPILSYAYLIYVYCKFRIYQLIDHKLIVKGEHVPYRFILANEDFLTFTSVKVTFREELSKVEALDSAMTYSLNPGERIERETTITCEYRGEYQVGANEVYVTDYLNLFRFVYQAPSPITVKVVPRVLHLNHLVFLSDPEGKDIKNHPCMNPSEPDIEVRAYVPADPMRMIHWKETARLSTMMTRKYTDEPKTEILLSMDLSKKKEADTIECIKLEDQIIECCLAIVDYFFRSNLPVRILYEDIRVQSMVITGKSEFEHYFSFCTEVRFRAEHAMDQLLYLTHDQISSRSVHIIVTHTLSNELIRQCYELKNLSKQIVVIYIGDKAIKEVVSQIDEQITFLQITSEDTIRNALEGKRDHNQ